MVPGQEKLIVAEALWGGSNTNVPPTERARWSRALARKTWITFGAVGHGPPTYRSTFAAARPLTGIPSTRSTTFPSSESVTLRLTISCCTLQASSPSSRRR